MIIPLTTKTEFEAMLWRHVRRYLDETGYGTLVDGNVTAIIEAPDAFDAALSAVFHRVTTLAVEAEGRARP